VWRNDLLISGFAVDFLWFWSWDWVLGWGVKIGFQSMLDEARTGRVRESWQMIVRSGIEDMERQSFYYYSFLYTMDVDVFTLSIMDGFV
jgi:hypothetical protein